uniref:Malectin_like domain-containing protein n=1 Tax=Mesocestoides corti TaxID=53468 RepID=A0A5K3EW19_MESCO
MTRQFCFDGTRLFSIIGSGNGAWEGRILSIKASSLPGRSPVYSLELTNNYVQLTFNQCTLFDNEGKPTVILAPIRITNFRMQLDVQHASAYRYAISNSRGLSSRVIAFPINSNYPNARTIYRLLKFFLDDFC